MCEWWYYNLFFKNARNLKKKVVIHTNVFVIPPNIDGDSDSLRQFNACVRNNGCTWKYKCRKSNEIVQDVSQRKLEEAGSQSNI